MTFKMLLVLLVLAVSTDLCLSACSENFGGCDVYNGMCWDTSRGRNFCTCKAGYRFLFGQQHQLKWCVDMDECQDHIMCGDNAQCVNTWGSYECHCNCGYVKDYTGTKCVEQSEIQGMCVRPSKCVIPGQNRNNNVAFRIGANSRYKTYEDFDITNNQDRQFWDYNMPRVQNPTCQCDIGFQHDACGLCVDINECTTEDEGEKHQCDPNSKCLNTYGSYVCQCRPNYFLGPCGKSCYRSQAQVPFTCDEDLSALLSGGPGGVSKPTSKKFGTGSYLEMVPVRNYRSCAEGQQGDVVVDTFDLDHDGVNDVTLTWTCENVFGESLSTLKKFSDREAVWGSWTCWTACRPTVWGGLQTRSRRCWYGLPGRGKCGGSGTEERDCSPKTEELRVRKDADTLTTDEKRDLVEAMEKYKADTSAAGFHNAAGSHGWPFQCGNGERESCCPHGAKLKFLTWHRSIVLNYEVGLSRHLKSKTLGLPYWNWMKGNVMPGILWDKTMFGRENPFSNCTVLIDREGAMRTIQRSDNVFADSLDSSRIDYNDIVTKFNRTENIQAFAENCENVHNGPHVAICGDGIQRNKCLISMGGLSFAAFDPIFMMHHNQVDRLSAIFENDLVNSGAWTWSPQTVLETYESLSDFSKPHMPFGNTSINPFRLVQKTANMHDFFYYKKLMGYEYDCLLADGCDVTGRNFAFGFRRPAGAAALLLAMHVRSIPSNIYVNFYENWANQPCSRLTSDEHIGRILILGAEKQKSFRNTIPTTIVYQSGFNINDDIQLTSCFTEDRSCLGNCAPPSNQTIANLLPSPFLLQQLENTPVDVFKFRWMTGNRMPAWDIVMGSGYQWIYFYGNRARNIVQVPSRNAFQNCITETSRAVECYDKPCIMPAGRFYLIDSDPTRCRNGLRLAIDSRK